MPYYIYFPDDDLRGEKAKPVLALPFYPDTESFLLVEDLEMAIGYLIFLHFLCRKRYTIPQIAGAGMFFFHDYAEVESLIVLRNSTRTIPINYYQQALDTVPYDMLNKFHKDSVMRAWPPLLVELQQELSDSRTTSVSSSNNVQ